MNGILLIDKPLDWTSSDVVAKLRGVLHEKRLGHSGTLDPMATGLLVLFAGRATRAVQFAESHEKRYLAHLRLGVTTDTQDITGSVLKTAPADISSQELEAALAGFRGRISQVPPMYSAIKIRGQKLYELARRGESVERAPRQITISDLRLTGRDGNDWLLDVTCSKGTYIRALCNDIGEALGCGGCMSGLRRLRCGEFTLDKAHSIDEVQQAADKGEAEKLLLPVDSLFAACPAYTAGEKAERQIRCGGAPKAALAAGEYRVYSESGEFLALCRSDGQTLKTVKSFFEPA